MNVPENIKNDTAFYESFDHKDNDKPFACSKFIRNLDVPYFSHLHWHENIEMIYLVSGKFNAFADNTVYNMRPGVL